MDHSDKHTIHCFSMTAYHYAADGNLGLNP